MFPHEQPSLFRNTVLHFGYRVDELENTEWGELHWECQEDEQTAREIRALCQRYIEAYDFLHGDPPNDEDDESKPAPSDA